MARKDLEAQAMDTSANEQGIFAGGTSAAPVRSGRPRILGRALPIVAGVQIEQRIPMYGYHAAPSSFARIHLFDPKYTKPVAALLQSGRALGHAFQPFEAHVPYLLQFMIDYNVAGMADLHLIAPRYRVPLPSSHSSRSAHVLQASEADRPLTAASQRDAHLHTPKLSSKPSKQEAFTGSMPQGAEMPPCIPLPSLLPFSARQWAAEEVTLDSIHAAGLVCHREAFFWRCPPCTAAGEEKSSTSAEQAAQWVWAGGSADKAAPLPPHRSAIHRFTSESHASASASWMEDLDAFVRCSVCELEVDVAPEQIDNPRRRRDAVLQARQKNRGAGPNSEHNAVPV